MTPFEPTKPRPDELLSVVWKRLFEEIVAHYQALVEEIVPKPAIWVNVRDGSDERWRAGW